LLLGAHTMKFSFRKVSAILFTVALISAGIGPSFATMPDGTPHDQPSEPPHDNGPKDHNGGGGPKSGGDTDNSINQDIKADSTSYGSQQGQGQGQSQEALGGKSESDATSTSYGSQQGQGQSIGDTSANGGNVQDSGNSSVGDTSATGGSIGPIKNNNNSTGGSVGDTSATTGPINLNNGSGASVGDTNATGGTSYGSQQGQSATGNGYGGTSENHNNSAGGAGGNGGSTGAIENNSAGGQGGAGGTSSSNGGAGGSAQNGNQSTEVHSAGGTGGSTGPINVNPTLTNGPNTNTQNGAPQTTTVNPILSNGPNMNSSTTGGNNLTGGANTVKNGSSSNNGGVSLVNSTSNKYPVAPSVALPGNLQGTSLHNFACVNGQVITTNDYVGPKDTRFGLGVHVFSVSFGSTSQSKNEAYYSALAAKNQTRAELMTADGVASHPLGGLFLSENTLNSVAMSGKVRKLSDKDQLALNRSATSAVQATIAKSKSGSVAMGCGKVQGGQVIINEPQIPVTQPQVPPIQVPTVPSELPAKN
jgi:hypothetical protein